MGRRGDHSYPCPGGRAVKMRLAAIVIALVISTGLVTALPAPAAAANAVQEAVDGSVAAALAHGIGQSVAVVDRQTGVSVASSGGDEVYISESIVKLFTVAYYQVQAGGQLDESMAQTLRTMIIHSDDRIESSLWNMDIVPTIAQRYGLSNTRNGPKTGPNDWGWELITANDEAEFLYKMSNDPEVAPLLMDAMANVASTGSDGFDQHFGMNALTGDHGSKQGWTDVGSSAQVQIHSVGWTDRYFVAILQTSTRSDYDTMRADSTHAARAVLEAEASVSAPETTTTSPTPPPTSPAATNPAATNPAATNPAATNPAATGPGPTVIDEQPRPAGPLAAVFGRLGAVFDQLRREIVSLAEGLIGLINEW